jgi:hypothetical protein
LGNEIELKPGYYLDNFHKLTGFVEEVYGDILNESERDFLDRFKVLPCSSQLFYVRLISRKGPLFRHDKLNYPEIPSLKEAAITLVDRDFMSLNEPAPVDQLLTLFTKPELAKLFSHMNSLTLSLKREEIETLLLEADNQEEIQQILTCQTDIYRPLGEEEVQTFRMLFFGNLYQNLSEFVITDLEVVRYESYKIDRENRLFNTRFSLDKALAYHRMGEEYFEKREAGLEDRNLISLAENLPDPGDEYFLVRKRDRLLNDMARQMERQDLAKEALAYYKKSSHTPARERRVRIHFNREEYEACDQLINEIKTNPLDEAERAFAAFFISKLKRKQGKKVSRPKPIFFKEESIFCDPFPEPSMEQHAVEKAALFYYEQKGYRGYYSENIIWNALFGLAFWDIIFHPLPGVFFNPFQRGPADLNSPEFRQRREQLFSRRFEQLAKDNEWYKILLDRYNQSEGISNVFINWKRIDRKMVEDILEAVSREHLLLIFDRISRDVRGNTSGFPDLILFPPAHEKPPFPYLLAEVKGPGDKLQKNQKRWISLFEKWEIPFMLVLLNWK